MDIAEPDYRHHTFQDGEVTPNDAKYAVQWHLDKISAPQAWAHTTGSKQVRAGPSLPRAASAALLLRLVVMMALTMAVLPAGGWRLPACLQLFHAC